MTDLVKEDIISEVSKATNVEEKTNHIQNDVTYTFLFYQMLISVCIVIILIFFKLVGGRFYGYTRQKYIATFDRSISFSDVVQTVTRGFDDSQDEDIKEAPELLEIYFSKIKALSPADEDETKEIISKVENELCWPVKGNITDTFGKRTDPFGSGEIYLHKGLDIAVPMGEEVKAAMDGIVNISRYDATYGNYIVITHSNEIKTVYAHLEERFCNVGDVVTKGQTVASAGNSGRSTGPHLHFEIIMGGTTRIDPLSLLPDEQS